MFCFHVSLHACLVPREAREVTGLLELESQMMVMCVLETEFRSSARAEKALNC